jgi:hypothetical protein
VNPFEVMRLAQLMHQERVNEALARHTHERRALSVPRPARPSIVPGLRRSLAEALRACAGRIEPLESTT